MLLIPFAENQRLFLQQSRPGLVSALLPTDFFFFPPLVGGGAALPTTMRRGTAISSSSGPLGA